MPDPISIDPSQLNTNAPDTNVSIPAPSPGSEKVSLNEFENFVPTGEKPVMEGNKLAKEQPAIKKVSETATAKDTKENVHEKVQKEVAAKVEDKGEVETKEEEVEDEEQLDETTGQEETDKESDVEEDEKIHGNSKRDYSGLSENEIRILKKLDNSRFSKIAPLIKTYKEAAGQAIKLAQELESSKKLLKEGGIPETWHEHPEAYQLSKEFQEINTQYSYQEQMENHYRQQKINIKQGKPWTALQWNKQTNQLEYSPQYEASDVGEGYVEERLIAANNAKLQLTSKAEAIKQTHANSYERAATTMKSEVDEVVSKMHPDVKPQEADVKLIQKIVPSQYANHPLAYGYAQLGAIILAQGRKLSTLMKDAEQVTRLNQDVRKNGAAKPPGLKRPSTPAKSETDKLRLSDFGDS